MKSILTLILFLCALATPHSASAFYHGDFKQIPVLHEGRVKPLDSFARIYLERFSGKQSLENLSAISWLAETLFNPAEAIEIPVFLVRNTALKTQLELPKDQKHFSFLDLQAPLERTAPQIETLITIDPKTRTAEQSELLQLHDHASSFIQIMRGLSPILPINIALPKDYAEIEPTYIALSKIETRLTQNLKKIVAQKGENLERYSDDEAKLAQLTFNLQLLRLGGERNTLLRIMPGVTGTDQQDWHTPWDAILNGHTTPHHTAYLNIWSKMANSYRNNNNLEWKTATLSARNHLKTSKISIPNALNIEVLYNTVKPFHWALSLYVLAGLLLSARFFLPFAATKLNTLNHLGTLSLGIGTFLHTTGIAARIFLLDRAPVGTLYESLIFVALICTGIALFSALRGRHIAAPLSGIISTIGLLAIAPLLITQGESMEMLVAVLNTNFWLSTHVLCITAGYGVSIMTACLGHAYLILRARDKDHPGLAKIQQGTYRFATIALLLTAVGTALGGVWADQSWGRFWGWDPKENGALLIVLWLIWVLHGRRSGALRTLHFNAIAAYLNVIVALAWFGVNLLSVGLHSYGFIDGIAVGLGSFVAAETIFIVGLFAYIKAKEREPHEA